MAQHIKHRIVGLLIMMLGLVSPVHAQETADCAPDDQIHQVSSTNSNYASISADGRYVSFLTFIALVPDDANTDMDIYVFDRTACTVERIGGIAEPVKSSLDNDPAAMSADGRLVVFQSASAGLVADDTNDAEDIFVFDRTTATVTRVSVATGGIEASGGNSRDPVISADGRWVAFRSDATNLVTGDHNAVKDIFLHEIASGTTTRVSVASDGSEATGGDSTFPVISADGGIIAFSSEATNLVEGDTNGQRDVFVHEVASGITTRVSVATDGTEGNLASYGVVMSADGQVIAFTSNADNLVADDTNQEADIWVHDRATSTTNRVSVPLSGAQIRGGGANASISADGQYIVFESRANDLVADDTNDAFDVFVHELATQTTVRVSVAADGSEAVGGGSNLPVLSADGRWIVFASWATNLVSTDSDTETEVYVTRNPFVD